MSRNNAGAMTISIKGSTLIREVSLLFNDESTSDTGCLRVSLTQDQGGGDFYYSGVPLPVFLAFRIVDSAGAYYVETIKANYQLYVPPSLGAANARCAQLLRKLTEANVKAASKDGRMKPEKKIYIAEEDIAKFLHEAFEAVASMNRAERELHG